MKMTVRMTTTFLTIAVKRRVWGAAGVFPDRFLCLPGFYLSNRRSLMKLVNYATTISLSPPNQFENENSGRCGPAGQFDAQLFGWRGNLTYGNRTPRGVN